MCVVIVGVASLVVVSDVGWVVILVVVLVVAQAVRVVVRDAAIRVVALRQRRLAGHCTVIDIGTQ